MDALGELIARVASRGTPVVVCFHSLDVRDFTNLLSPGRISATFGRAARILVHATPDLEKLGYVGLGPLAMLFEQGVSPTPPADPSRIKAVLGLTGATPLVGTYGFLNPDKGVEELIDALALLRQSYPGAVLLLVTAEQPRQPSQTTAQEVRRRIASAGLDDAVLLVNDYLSDAVSLLLLQACDVVAFPRRETNEASSASVRMAVAAQRPLLLSHIRLFDEFTRLAEYLPAIDPESIARAIAALTGEPARGERLVASQKAWQAEHAWAKQSSKLQALLLQLQEAREAR